MAAILHEWSRSVPTWVNEYLARFGKTPYGQNIYRVVWGPSRADTVGGLWLDTGRAEYRTIPRYDKECYVLEKWMTQTMSRDEWVEMNFDTESQLLSLGPYPECGDYYICYSLMRDDRPLPLTQEVVMYYCRLIEAGKAFSLAQRRAAISQDREAKEAERHNRISDMFDDAQPTHGHNSITFGYGKSGTRKRPEDVPMKYSAEDLGLPSGPGLHQVG